MAIVAKDVERGLPQQFLRLNRGTDYGQHYRFARITTPKSYKQAEDAVYKAVSEVMPPYRANLVDLTTMVDYEVFPCRYNFYVELGYPEKDGVECSETLLEDALCRIKPHYHSIRQTNRLGQLALQVVRPGTFEKLKKILIARGASACQVKIPRVIRDRELAGLLTANTLPTVSDTLLAV